MKNKSTTILSVLTALLVVLCTLGPAKAGPPARPNLQGGAPTVVSYQGQVIVDSSPYTGPGYFKFVIVDADGTTTCWSNDGTSTNGGEPTDAVRLTVTEGLFNVLLGDTTLDGMTESLTAKGFERPDCYLRVWFSSDNNTFSQLTPDTRIAAVPYALQAQEAADADTVDGYQGAALEESSEIDADIAAHTAIADAHHTRYTDGEAWAATLANDGPGSGLNADTVDGQHGSYYQARVSGTCAVGSTVRVINADGTVVCQADALNRAVAPTANVNAILDGHRDSVGQYTSITVGKDGLGLISYYDATNSDLKVAHCDNPACTSFTVNTVDSTGSVGQHTSITIGADGLPLISYYDATSHGLKVAQCADWTCTHAISTTVDAGTGDVGWYTSLTIGADGLPLISFYNNGDLEVAHCDNRPCTSATLATVDNAGTVGLYTSVAIGVDGLPLISYYDATNGHLKVAHCDDLACTSATINTLSAGGIPGNDYGLYTSVTIGTDGLPLISFYYYDDIYGDDVGYLEVAHCKDPTCGVLPPTVTALDGGTEAVYYYYTSVTVGADGLPLISYYQYDDTNHVGDLKVARCNNLDCTSSTVTTLDTISEIGEDSGYTSVTIGADGLPLISYYDNIDSDLKMFHCGSVFCTPYFRRR